MFQVGDTIVRKEQAMSRLEFKIISVNLDNSTYSMESVVDGSVGLLDFKHMDLFTVSIPYNKRFKRRKLSIC